MVESDKNVMKIGKADDSIAAKVYLEASLTTEKTFISIGIYTSRLATRTVMGF